MKTEKSCDLLITNIDIVTMNAAREIITDGAVAVAGNTICAMGPTADITAKYRAARMIPAAGKYLFPGFISTHTHLFQTLLRGLGRDKPLLEWLDASVRRTLHCYREEHIHHAALLGLAEAVRSGTTTVLDYQYCHPVPGLDIPVMEAFAQIGVRGILGRTHTEVGSFPPEAACPHAESEEEHFRVVEELAARCAGNDMLSLAIAPGIIWDHTERGFIRTREIADALGIPITMHIVETEDDDRYALQQWGQRAIPFLDRCGLLKEDFIAVHAVHMLEEDLDLFARRGVSVAHCPVANMILASGTARVPEMLAKGIPVSLAYDGAASNDSQSMLDSMKFAALQHKLVSRNAAAVGAQDVLDMATVGGARALRMEQSIGSIETGKRADMFIYDPLFPHSVPVHDPVSSLVYSSGPANVETVIINGTVVLDQGKLTGIDEHAMVRKARDLAHELVDNAGLR